MKAKTRSDTGLPTVIGIDIGKEVFHLVGLGADGRIALRRKIKRKRLGLKDAFERLPPCIVGMEACLSAHFVSRTLPALGHEPRIHSGDLPQALREGPEERLQRCRDHRRSGVASEPALCPGEEPGPARPAGVSSRSVPIGLSPDSNDQSDPSLPD